MADLSIAFDGKHGFLIRGITNFLYKSIVKHYFTNRSNYFHLSDFSKTVV